MIFVNVTRSWPEVLAGARSAEDSVLGDWSALSESKLHQYADAIVGVADGRVVAVFDVTSWHHVGVGDRVRFEGSPSTRWSPLVGTSSHVTWKRGQARPTRFVDTAEVASLAPAPAGSHRDRVSVGPFTLQLVGAADAVLHIPAGARVTIVTSADPT